MKNQHVAELSSIEGVLVQTDSEAKLHHNKPARYGDANDNYMAVITASDHMALVRIIRYCNDNNIKIVTRSGGTALTKGSSIDEHRPQGDYIILKLYEADKIKPAEYLGDGRLRVFPGNTTKIVNEELAKYGRVVSVDLGIGDKAGLAQILGYIATDAAGTGAAMKGRGRDIVESLTVLTTNGRISKIPSRCSTCPTLDDIVGMGGTTGIILEAVIRTAELPKKKQVAVVNVKDIGQMYDLLESLKRNAWDKLNLFERLNQELFEQVIEYTGRQNHRETNNIRALGAGDLLFIELASTNINDNLISPLKKSLKETGLLRSSIIAETEGRGEFLLDYRVVNASKACDDYADKHGGEVIGMDISVPVGDTSPFPGDEVLNLLKEKIPGIKLFSFGHAAGVELITPQTAKGGTAIHFNPVVPANTAPEVIDWVKRVVFTDVAARGGKIVSEHTPGTKLANYFEEFMPQAAADFIAKKLRWDSNNILNPGAYVSQNKIEIALKERAATRYA